jgi:hypothetical protein
MTITQKYRRLAAGIGLVGAGALALLAGPASAHQWNGNPSMPASNSDETPPAGADGSHPITITLGTAGGATNSISKSRPAGCDSNGGSFAGGTCNVEHITFNMTSPSYNGVASHQVTGLMCVSKLAAPTVDGGGDDPLNSCDFANGRGLASIGVAGSGLIFLDGSGNLPSTADDGQCTTDPDLCGPGTKAGIQLDAPSCVTNTNPSAASTVFDGGMSAFAQASCSNANQNAVCPPNPSHISGGWGCIITVAEFDGAALTADDHVGFRTINMKPPIPVSTEATPNTIVSAPPTCNGSPCTAGPSGSYGPIAPGVDVKIFGRRFPCREVRPDDPATVGAQNTCLTAWSTKTVLVKRISTQLLEPSATVLSQTAGTDGSYTITFDMPNVVGSGFADSYRFVPHSPACPGGFLQGDSPYENGPQTGPPFLPDTCESGQHNASGIRLFQT